MVLCVRKMAMVGTCRDGSTSLIGRPVWELVVAFCIHKHRLVSVVEIQYQCACQQLSICWSVLFTERAGSSLLQHMLTRVLHFPFLPTCLTPQLLILFCGSSSCLSHRWTPHRFIILRKLGLPIGLPALHDEEACQLCTTTTHESWCIQFCIKCFQIYKSKYCMYVLVCHHTWQLIGSWQLEEDGRCWPYTAGLRTRPVPHGSAGLGFNPGPTGNGCMNPGPTGNGCSVRPYSFVPDCTCNRSS